MSSIPDEDDNRPAATEPDWQARTGLTLRQAEDLLDLLEAAGVTCREVAFEADGVTVRWRPRST